MVAPSHYCSDLAPSRRSIRVRWPLVRTQRKRDRRSLDSCPLRYNVPDPLTAEGKLFRERPSCCCLIYLSSSHPSDVHSFIVFVNGPQRSPVLIWNPLPWTRTSSLQDFLYEKGIIVKRPTLLVLVTPTILHSLFPLDAFVSPLTQLGPLVTLPPVSLYP